MIRALGPRYHSVRVLQGPCVTNIPASWQTEGCRGDPGAVCPVGLGNLQKHKVTNSIKGRFEKENIPKSLCSA